VKINIDNEIIIGKTKESKERKEKEIDKIQEKINLEKISLQEYRKNMKERYLNSKNIDFDFDDEPNFDQDDFDDPNF
jgi:hypothetical protein